jgi:hypothetical protein
MLMDGGGFGTITGSTFRIKQEAVTPGSASGLTAAEIEQLFSYLPDPSLVSESGQAHTAASEVLADIADSLVKHVQVLSEAWGGTAAQAAVTGFGQLHETAIALAQASAKTGAVLSWLGGTILPFYKNYKAPALSAVGHIEAALGHNPSDIAAQQVLERLNNRLVQANANLPPNVSKNLPGDLGTAQVPLAHGSGSGGAGGGAAAGAVGGLAGAAGGGGAGGLASGGTGGPGGAAGRLGGEPPGSPGATTTLASAPGGAGGGAPGPVTPGGPGSGGGAPVPVTGGGSGPGGAGTVPVLPGAPGASGAGGGVSGEVPGAPGAPGLAGQGAGGDGMIGEGVVGVAPGDSAVIGSDGMIGVAPGDPGAVGADGTLADGTFADGSLGASGTGTGTGAAGFAGADGAATDAAGQEAAGGTGFPMMGGAGGNKRETERRRQAWMAEDADVWAGQADTAPSQIGT